MLLLTRCIGESIKISDSITITVMTITGNQVRIGIDAPKSIPVHRQEVFDRVAQESATSHPL